MDCCDELYYKYLNNSYCVFISQLMSENGYLDVWRNNLFMMED